MKIKDDVKKTFYRISGLILVFLLVCVRGVESQSISPMASFAGNWTLTFAGALNGSGTMTASSDGNLSIYLSIGKYQHLFSNPVLLKVSNAGALHGSIFFLGIKIGGVIGMFSSTGDLYGEVSTPVLDVGTVTGHLTQNSGNGTYQSVAGKGTWSVEKN